MLKLDSIQLLEIYYVALDGGDATPKSRRVLEQTMPPPQPRIESHYRLHERVSQPNQRCQPAQPMNETRKRHHTPAFDVLNDLKAVRADKALDRRG